MLSEVFAEQDEAEVTIKIGDYVITMTGQIDPPEIDTNRFDNGLYAKGYQNHLIRSDINAILLKVKPKGRVVATQWRWTIPLAIKPRIEEE